MKALTLAAASVLATVAISSAQDAPGGNAERRPVPPIIAALDANKDGVIDADEIAKAPAALKTLDKDGDGKLSREETMPGRGGRRGGERGEGAPRPGGNQ
jgi:hypothetical protein